MEIRFTKKQEGSRKVTFKRIDVGCVNVMFVTLKINKSTGHMLPLYICKDEVTINSNLPGFYHELKRINFIQVVFIYTTAFDAIYLYGRYL